MNASAVARALGLVGLGMLIVFLGMIPAFNNSYWLLLWQRMIGLWALTLVFLAAGAWSCRK